MDENDKRKWGEFLNPDVMRSKLISASIYIAGFESLKDAIVSRLRSFYSTGFDESGELVKPQYTTEVLARNRSPVFASIDWFLECEVITKDDVQSFERVRNCRNRLAHELLTNLESETLQADLERSFEEMFRLLRKVEVWWIVNVEIPTNPDFDDVTVNEDEIIPGRIATLHMLIQIALGDDATSRSYYDEFVRRVGARTSVSGCTQSCARDPETDGRG